MYSAILYIIWNLHKVKDRITLSLCVYQMQYLFLHSPLTLGNGLIWSRWCAVGRNHLGCCGRGVTKCDCLVLFRWVAQILGWTTGVRLCSLKSLCDCWDERKMGSSINKHLAWSTITVWSSVHSRITGYWVSSCCHSLLWFPTFPRVNFNNTRKH